MIGSNIRTFRKSRGLTQAQLGALCGMTGGAISSYENGATIPKRRVIEKLAQALEVPADKIAAASPPVIPPAASDRTRQSSDGLLYDGILSVLREMYGVVEGRVIVGENGASKKYYVIHPPAGSFILYEEDIAAIVRSAKASMSPLVEHMKRERGKSGHPASRRL